MTHHLKMMVRDLTNRVDQSILLRDCADICTLTAKYVARDSCFAKRSAVLCAEICVVCGNECTKFNDQMSQHCAMVCFNCARHCNEFASGKMNH
ncbi:MAG TPA: hypothetical protein VHQ24_15245 [Lachnospiraceae bacterium]|nr:hypothetical protein [Lachnospiraceae bacterium]